MLQRGATTTFPDRTKQQERSSHCAVSTDLPLINTPALPQVVLASTGAHVLEQEPPRLARRPQVESCDYTAVDVQKQGQQDHGAQYVKLSAIPRSLQPTVVQGLGKSFVRNAVGLTVFAQICGYPTSASKEFPEPTSALKARVVRAGRRHKATPQLLGAHVLLHALTIVAQSKLNTATELGNGWKCTPRTRGQGPRPWNQRLGPRKSTLALAAGVSRWRRQRGHRRCCNRNSQNCVNLRSRRGRWW